MFTPTTDYIAVLPTPDGDAFPLHNAAKLGKVEEVEDLLTRRNVLAPDYKVRTALHYAACCGHQKNAARCIQLILNCRQLTELKEKAPNIQKDFINAVDINGDTALHLAAKNESKKVVEMLILADADVTINNNEKTDALELIYSKVPTAMLSILNLGITAKDGYEITDENLRICFNFETLVGYPHVDEQDDIQYLSRETELLSYALDDSRSTSKDILGHPLVKVFLELKWKKIRFLFWFSMLFHIAWLLVYTVFIAEVYLQSCPYRAFMNKTEDPDHKRFTWLGLPMEHEQNRVSTCELTMSNHRLLYVLLAMTAIVAFKEFFELSSSRKLRLYFKGLENYGQWALIISVSIITWPVLFANNSIAEWMYEVAAFGIFVAWSLILSQIGKHPRLGLHVEILVRVLKSFAMFMLIFASLLIAFALSLSLLLPGNQAFISLPLAFMKVIVMMTGELDYDDFFSGDEAAFPVSGRIIYLFFVIIVSITLFNLLIGFTVSDIQGLQKKAEINKLSNQLEQIFLMETFILSRKVQCLLCRRRTLLQKFMVASQPVYYVSSESIRTDELVVEKSIKEIPAELQRTVRAIAAENSFRALARNRLNNPEYKKYSSESTKAVKRIVKEVLRTKGLA